jgi:hypothetical protein
MQVVQTLLKRPSPDGPVYTVAWLPDDPRVHRGSVVTLKDDAGTWQVEEQWARQDTGDIQRGWGLDLPKSQRTER